MKPGRIYTTIWMVGCLIHGLVAQTPVSGTIGTNTFWPASGNPYIVTADITVAPSATLTLESGVELQFEAGTGMQVNGKFIALGTEVDSIIITSRAIEPMPGDWSGIVVEGELAWRFVRASFARRLLTFSGDGRAIEVISHVEFSRNDTALISERLGLDSMKFDQVHFHHNRVGVLVDSNAVFLQSIFESNDWGIQGGRIRVVESEFLGNGYGAVLEASEIINCRFLEQGVLALEELNSSVLFNVFVGNETGIRTRMGPLTHISGNSLNANQRGLLIGPNPLLSQDAVISDNGFCENVIYHVETTSDPGTSADLSGNCWCDTDSANIALLIRDENDTPGLGKVIFTPFDATSCFPGLVYPGDTDHDRIADVFDILPIGLKYGQSGPVRPNASTDWIGQESPDWPDNLPSGLNVKHVDANGDGLISEADVDAILINYRNRHSSLRVSTHESGIPLKLLIPQQAAHPGDTVIIPVEIGNISALADNLYGVAFSLNYDTSVVEAGSMKLNFSNSWLGTSSLDMITIQRDDFLHGKLSAGLVRTDQVGKNGMGYLADITVVIDDDLTSVLDSLPISFEKIEALNALGEEILMDGQAGEVIIQLTSLFSLYQKQTRIYPNPAQSNIILSFNNYLPREIRLINVSGQQIQHIDKARDSIQKINVEKLSSGFYWISIDTGEGIIQKRLVILR